MENMQKCYERYVCTHAWERREVIKVIDIGGANVNGSYADIFSNPPFSYLAVDIATNENVDVVLDDPYQLPFADGSVDIVMSGQAFEHVEFFWLLFQEMVRVLKPDGLILLIAPSSGPIHRYPVDCYRFHPDAYRALASYTQCQLVDVWHDDRGPWDDVVGVFSKSSIPRYQYRGKPDSPARWGVNRYEQLTLPSIRNAPHPDPAAERLQGKLPYLEVMKRLHQTLQPRDYFEIGVRHGHSLRLARCNAVGVDPSPDITQRLEKQHQLVVSSSDEFFEFLADAYLASATIDLAFIDGMHLFEFVLRDFINVEKYATSHTVVVVDDIFPNHLLQANRERTTAAWAGDVWKLTHCLKTHRPELNLIPLDTYPTGLLLITGLQPGTRVLKQKYNPIVRHYLEMMLSGAEADLVLKRTEACDPENEVIWRWLDELRQSRSASDPRNGRKVVQQLGQCCKEELARG